MKTYDVVVTKRGGLWRGQREKFAVRVEAADKHQAATEALNIAEREFKGREYEELRAGKITLVKISPVS